MSGKMYFSEYVQASREEPAEEFDHRVVFASSTRSTIEGKTTCKGILCLLRPWRRPSDLKCPRPCAETRGQEVAADRDLLPPLPHCALVHRLLQAFCLFFVFFFTLKITTAAFYISLREADSAAGTSVWIKLKTRSNLVLALTCGLRQASDWLLPKKKCVCRGGGWGWLGWGGVRRVKFAEADFTFRLMQSSPWGSCEYIKDVY